MNHHKGHIKFTLLAALLLLCLALAACKDGTSAHSAAASPTDTDTPPAVVSLSDTSLTVGKGITAPLTANGGDNITWHSSDETVATVDDSGLVRGESVGTCVITAHNEQGSEAECQVEVKKTCYLTFDDGPNEHTASILDVLKEYDVPATFFVVSSYYLELTQQMQEQGCLVGIHTYSHNYDSCYRSYSSYYYGVELMARRVEQYTGVRPNVIRFPGGTHNSVSDPLLMQRVLHGATDLGYRPFDWTATSGDSSQENASAAFSVKNVKESCTDDVEIILMHDRGFNAKALQTIIPYLWEQGYVFETLDHYPEYSYTFPTRYSKKNKDIPATSVDIGLTSVTLKVGEKVTLTARMQPSASTDYIRWESSAPAIADVLPDGTVEALSPGEAEIYAITSGGKKATSQCVIRNA